MMSIENPTLALVGALVLAKAQAGAREPAAARHFRHFSSLFTKFSSTTVESSLQIDLFMQNKANF